MIARLRDPAQRARIKQDMLDANATTWENQWMGSGGGDLARHLGVPRG